MNNKILVTALILSTLPHTSKANPMWGWYKKQIEILASESDQVADHIDNHIAQESRKFIESNGHNWINSATGDVDKYLNDKFKAIDSSFKNGNSNEILAFITKEANFLTDRFSKSGLNIADNGKGQYAKFTRGSAQIFGGADKTIKTLENSVGLYKGATSFIKNWKEVKKAFTQINSSKHKQQFADAFKILNASEKGLSEKNLIQLRRRKNVAIASIVDLSENHVNTLKDLKKNSNTISENLDEIIKSFNLIAIEAVNEVDSEYYPNLTDKRGPKASRGLNTFFQNLIFEKFQERVITKEMTANKPISINLPKYIKKPIFGKTFTYVETEMISGTPIEDIYLYNPYWLKKGDTAKTLAESSKKRPLPYGYDPVTRKPVDNLNDDLKQNEVARNQNEGNGDTDEGSTDGNDGNTDGGDGNTDGETTPPTTGGETNPPTTGGGEEQPVVSKLFFRSVDATGITKIREGLVSGSPPTSIEDNTSTVIKDLSESTSLGSYNSISWGSWKGLITKGPISDPDRSIETHSALSYWIEGTQTSSQNLPTQGQATYSGSILGSGRHGTIPFNSSTINGYLPGISYQMKGEFTSSIDFTQSNITNSINSLSLTDSNLPDLSIINSANPIVFSESSLENGNFFSQQDENVAGFSETRFKLSGSLYGSDADNIGGFFSADARDINSPGFTARGIFVGEKQNPPPAVEPLTTYSAHIGTIEALNGDILSSEFDTSQSNVTVATSFGPGNGVEHNVTKETISSNQHLTWGRWNGQVSDGSRRLNADFTKGHWITGRITPSQSIPMEGNATYDGKLLGSAQLGASIHDLTGDFQMNIDFTNGSISNTLSRVVYYDNFGANTIIDANGAVISGSLHRADSSISLQGTYNSSNINNQFNGTKILMDGNLYGSNADAVGGTFRMLNTRPMGGKVLDANGIFFSTSKTQN